MEHETTFHIKMLDLRYRFIEKEKERMKSAPLGGKSSRAFFVLAYSLATVLVNFDVNNRTVIDVSLARSCC